MSDHRALLTEAFQGNMTTLPELQLYCRFTDRQAARCVASLQKPTGAGDGTEPRTRPRYG